MPRLYQRITVVALAAFALLNITYLFASHRDAGSLRDVLSQIGLGANHTGANAIARARYKYLAGFTKRLVQFTPDMPELEVLKEMGPLVKSFNDPDRPAAVPEFFDGYVNVSPEQIESLRKLHRKVVDSIPRVPPAGLYSNSRGIVMTGGGAYFPLLLNAIKWLVDRHDNIPIEVFMAKEEYEPEYCEQLFPELGVRCMIIEDIYGMDTVSKFDYMGYPLKILAILASSFDNVYFMDVDSLPLMPLTTVFDTQPYDQDGLVLFPDYWMRLTSPAYYDVAGIKLQPALGQKGAVEIYDMEGVIPQRVSTESGQIAVRKSQHFASLLLALYYNLNGFPFYFRLLNQTPDTPGFGDKDTFAAAAHVFREPCYQVEKEMHTLGYFDDAEPHEFHGFAIVQHHPAGDYAWSKAKLTAGAEPPRIPYLTLHANSIKLSPVTLFMDDNPGPEREKDVKRRWLKLESKRYFGRLSNVNEVFSPQNVGDIELEMFDTVRYTVCEWMLKKQLVPLALKGHDIQGYCTRASEHVTFLAENPEVV